MEISRRTGFTVAFFALWLATIIYSYWYITTGWDKPPIIWDWTEQFHDIEQGWATFVFKGGEIRWLTVWPLAYAAIVPVLYVYHLYAHRNHRERKFFKRFDYVGAFGHTLASFLIGLFYTLVAIFAIYSLLFGIRLFDETYPVASFLLQGLLVLSVLLGVGTLGVKSFAVIFIELD